MGRDKYTKIARGVRIREYPSGNRAYQIQFSYRGVQCRECLKISVTNANNRYACNLKGEIDNAIGRKTFRYSDYFPDSPRAKTFGHAVSTITIRELLESWLSDIKRSHPHSTYRAYRKPCDSLWIPTIGDIRVSDLARNPEPIREVIRGRNTTLKTVRNDLTPLRAIFDQAVEDHLVERNPLDRIKVRKLVTRRKSNYKVDPYSLEEIETILKVASEQRPEWRPYWQFAFSSGLRTSEQYASKWIKVDWRDQSLLVDEATVERQEKGTKTEASERTLELLPMAYGALQDQRAFTETWSDYIFINPRTRRPIRDYEESASVLKYLCQRAGIRYRMQRQTRHSFASNLLSGGENPYRVAEMLGHKNVQMVFSVYGRWIDQGRRKQKRQYVSEFANLGAKRHLSGTAK